MGNADLPHYSRTILNSITPYEPGKPISEVEREFGLKSVIKLASNENPLGPSPMAVKAVKAALSDLHRYPDGAGYHLKQKLATKFVVPPNWIVLGNGSTELVELVTEAFVGPEDEVVIGRYEFFKYRLAVQIMDGRSVWVEMPGLEYDVQDILAKITPRTKVIFIANPNNPTGTLMTVGEADWLMERIRDDVVVVFDEAYFDYRNESIYPDTMKYLQDGKNVVIMRTFSKSYGLAGLRVGYAITTPGVAQSMNRVRETFNVNSLGQIGAMAALDDVEFLKKGIELNRIEKEFFYGELSRMGMEYVPTEANFVLIKTPVLGRELFKRLLKQGIIVRPVDGYGLPEYVRVSIGLPEENRAFFEALRGIL